MLVDTHCHLDAAEFDADRDEVVRRALDAGVARIVVPSVERANFGAVASVCREHACCRPAYGIHPLYVDRAREEDLDALRDALISGGAVAVGEIGLDRFVAERDDDRQAFFFSEQLKIARDLGLPVLLHVRRAVDAVLAHLRKIPVRRGIAHAFNGSRQQAEEFIRLGFKLGFGGAATFPRATRLRALAAALPIGAIVLETDSPDMPPAWIGRGRNEPAELPRIAAAVAGLRGIAPEEMIRASSENFHALAGNG